MFLELNIDSLIGPTHHYGGLAFGNKASMESKYQCSHPKQAALQGLEKMWKLSQLGVPQLVFLPQNRPALTELNYMGFDANPLECVNQCAELSTELLSSIYSSSYMWMANAGHFSPSCDTYDGQSHFTPSNFSAQFHRSLEVSGHISQFQSLFQGDVIIHSPVVTTYSDEGAANDTRFCDENYEKGVYLFVYSYDAVSPFKTRYPCRQSKEVYDDLIKEHGLSEESCIIARQHPNAINSGVFHNDVISVGHKNVFLCHEFSFENQSIVLTRLIGEYHKKTGKDLMVHCISDLDIPLDMCVASYLFNSQLITTYSNELIMVAPKQCELIPQVKRYIEHVLLPSTPIQRVLFVDLTESMKNGGGPACLRLRMVLDIDQYNKISSSYKLTKERYLGLKNIIEKYYPETIVIDDFCDPSFFQRVQRIYERFQDTSVKRCHLN